MDSPRVFLVLTSFPIHLCSLVSPCSQFILNSLLPSTSFHGVSSRSLVYNKTNLLSLNNMYLVLSALVGSSLLQIAFSSVGSKNQDRLSELWKISSPFLIANRFVEFTILRRTVLNNLASPSVSFKIFYQTYSSFKNFP